MVKFNVNLRSIFWGYLANCQSNSVIFFIKRTIQREKTEVLRGGQDEIGYPKCSANVLHALGTVAENPLGL